MVFLKLSLKSISTAKSLTSSSHVISVDSNLKAGDLSCVLFLHYWPETCLDKPACS